MTRELGLCQGVGGGLPQDFGEAVSLGAVRFLGEFLRISGCKGLRMRRKALEEGPCVPTS